MEGSPPAAGEPGELPNLPVRLALVFVAPGALFDRLRRRPAWIGVLLALVLLSLAAPVLLPQELVERLIRSQMGPEGGQVDVESLVPVAYVSAALLPPLLTVTVAGFVYFSYTLVLGGQATFRQLFSATAHAMVVTVVGELVLVPLMVIGDDPQLRLALHLLVPGLDPDTYLFSLLRGLDVFDLWTASVVGVAVGRLYDRRSAGAAAAFLVAAYVAIRAAVALATGA